MKDDPNLKRITQMAELDQAATGLANMARLLATFYQELLTGGMPPELAASLTQDYFETMRERMLPP